MRLSILSLILTVLLSSCSNELSFEIKNFNKKSTLLCKENCPEIKISIPFAKNNTIAADSINKKIFTMVNELVYRDEKPIENDTYDVLLASFIASYDATKNEFPDATFGWEAKIRATVKYHTEALLNIEINHYSFTGGAHGYEGRESLVFDPKTGAIIPNERLFRDSVEFKKGVEKKFRTKYQIPLQGSINQTGYLFENDEFQLPKNIFFTSDGLLLHYNQYEVAAYAEGPKTLFLPYTTLKKYLLLK